MKQDKAKTFYIFIGLLFFSMLYITYRFFNGSGTSTVGITYAKEYKINAERPSFIKTVHVVAGQQVKTGDVLLEVSSNALEMDIDILENKIYVLKAEQVEKAKLINSKVAYLHAANDIEVGDIDADITQIQSQLQLNKQLTKEFKTGQQNTDDSQNPLQVKASSLDKQKKMHLKAIEIKIADIMQDNNTEQTVLRNQIKLMERQLELLLNEKKKLVKYATFDGLISNVYVKAGEEVNSYVSLLSAIPTHPTTVVGYFTGRRVKELDVAALVNIMSYNHPLIKTTGKVMGFGSVVELPDILQKSTAVKAFGRQVFIEINASNAFATGEKVLIK